MRSTLSAAAGRARRHFATCIRMGLPCRCALCAALSPEPVCSACMRAHWPAPYAVCARCVQCAYPLNIHTRLESGSAPLCGQCIAAPPAFDATLALADYAAPLDTLVAALKFRSKLALAPLFAQQLATRIHPPFLDSRKSCPDLTLPVPLSSRRLIARGYNQAWEIARPLARMLGLRAHPALLERIIDTPPQTSLPAKARRRNMRRAFALAHAHPAFVRGRHIAVVDDVMTSGATLESVARVLKRAGAARVTNWVVLRTPK